MLSAIKTNRVVIHKHIKPTMKKIFFFSLGKINEKRYSTRCVEHARVRRAKFKGKPQREWETATGVWWEPREADYASPHLSVYRSQLIKWKPARFPPSFPWSHRGFLPKKNQQPLLLHLSPSRRPTDERTPERIRPRPPDPAMDGASRPPLPPGAGVRVRAPLVSSAPLPFSSRSSLGGARFSGGVRRGWVLGSKAPPLGRKLRSFGSGMRGLGVRDWRFWWIPSRLGVSGSERLATWRHGLWFAWFLVAFFCAAWLMGNR